MKRNHLQSLEYREQLSIQQSWSGQDEVFGSTDAYVVTIGHGHRHNGVPVQSPFATKQLESIVKRLRPLAAYQSSLLRSVLDTISRIGADGFLFQIARGVPDKYADYVISDLCLDGVFHLRRHPGSPRQ